MKRTVTVLAHRRPEYLRQTLEALANCDGIDDWQVLIVMDRPSVTIWEIVDECVWPCITLELDNGDDPPYSRVSRATLLALSLGFATADYVAHLEEDVVPAPDFLTWHSAMAEMYREALEVFTVAAWWQVPGLRGYTSDDPPKHGFAQHFTPWGWGTWRDRFDEMRDSWSLDFWDRHLNEVVRGDRLTVHPLVARCRDIGEFGGVSSPEEWRERQAKEPA